jgi:hypothetical protein
MSIRKSKCILIESRPEGIVAMMGGRSTNGSQADANVPIQTFGVFHVINLSQPIGILETAFQHF